MLTFGKSKKKERTTALFQGVPRSEIFHKSSLELYKNTAAALAVAVIQQWKDDGSPQGDLPMIQLWRKVLADALRLKDGE